MMPPRPTKLVDWNVVVTLQQPELRQVRRILRQWGQVERTGYYNVLVMRVADPATFAAEFAAAAAEQPGLLDLVSHVVPAQQSFWFAGSNEFEQQARAIALGWLADLAGSSFHVRLHRRGFKGVIATQPEERFLDEALLAALAAAGTPGRIAFDDPDRVIQIETVDGRAGMSLWTREDLRRFPFLGAD